MKKNTIKKIAYLSTFLIAGITLFSSLSISNLTKKASPVNAATADRLLYFEKANVDGLPWWWITDETLLHYWSSGTGDVEVKMDKIEATIFTVTIPGTLLDSGGGFRFIVHNRDNTHNQTQWNDATTYRDNGHNYFLLTKWNGEGNYLTTESSIYGATYEVTKYRGGTVIGTDEVPKDDNYTPSFVYQQGYKLEGWYTNSGLTTPYVVGKLSSDISLYGKYTAVSDYYVYFRKPDAWGSSINAYYFYEGAGIPLGCQCENWPGDPMTDVMAGGHGYAIKVDAGYNPNTIIFNDGSNQTGDTALVAGKVYTYVVPEAEQPANLAIPHDFEYRLFKSWAPWDDDLEELGSDYIVGNGVTVAIKAGDTVKMNISSQIWAPFSKLTGANLATYFENNPDDGNYKAKLDGVYKFTFNQSFALGAATETKTAQISADNSTVSFELVTVENDKIAAVNQRLADINTCVEFNDYNIYKSFVANVLGASGMTLIDPKYAAKLNYMESHSLSMSQNISISVQNTTTNTIIIISVLLSLTLIGGLYIVRRKKQLN